MSQLPRVALFANLALQQWGCSSCTVGAVIDDPGLTNPTDSELSDSGSSADTSLPGETGESTETGKDTSSGQDSGPDGDSGSGKDTAQSKDSGGDSGEPKDTGETPVDTGDVEEPGSCSVVLAVDTVVIEEDGVYSDDGAQLWVCGGVTLSYTGNSAAILVEERGGLVASGSGSRIHALDRSDVILTGAKNEVFAESGADVTGADPLVSCDEIEVDSSAVKEGC